MSDYISKSALLDFLEEELKQDRPDGFKIYNTKRYIEDIPTVDEKEIIRKAFERVVVRLGEEETRKRKISEEELEECCFEMFHLYRSEADGIKQAIEICKEEGGIE